jgi:hypothetical protein
MLLRVVYNVEIEFDEKLEFEEKLSGLCFTVPGG